MDLFRRVVFRPVHRQQITAFMKGQQGRIFQGEHRHRGHHGIGDGKNAILFVARIRKLLGSLANLLNERIEREMSPRFGREISLRLGRNGSRVQHEGDSQNVSVFALHVPMRAAKIPSI